MGDPSGRVDKTMDEMWKTKKCFQHYRPQLCPHFTHSRPVLITIISYNFFYFLILFGLPQL